MNDGPEHRLGRLGMRDERTAGEHRVRRRRPVLDPYRAREQEPFVWVVGRKRRARKRGQHDHGAQMEGDRADTHVDTHVDIEQVANALDELDLLMPGSHGAPASPPPPRVM